MQAEPRTAPEATNGHAETSKTVSKSSPPLRVEAALRPEPLPEPKASPKRPFAILAGVVAVVLVGIGAYVMATAGQESTDDAQVMSDMVPIGTRVPGQIVQIAIQENQTVKKGDLIARLDDADYAAKVKQAEAELASAKAQAASADAQVD